MVATGQVRLNRMAAPDIPLDQLPALLAQLEDRGAVLRDSHYKLLSLAPRPADATEVKVTQLMAERWRTEVRDLAMVEAQLRRWHKVASTEEQHAQLSRFEMALERYSAYVTACTLAVERLLTTERPLHGAFVARPLTYLVVLEEWVADAAENAQAILEPLRQTREVLPELDDDLRERLDWAYERASVDARAFLKVVERWQAEPSDAETQARLVSLKRDLDVLIRMAGEIVTLL